MNATMMLSQGSLLYLTQVAEALSDLSDSDRAELLDEVQQHLLAIADNTGQTTHSELQTRLGSPGDYAAELRRSAGVLPDQGTAPAGVVSSDPAAPTLPRPFVAVWSYLRSLAPAWWALRGYLVAGLIFTLAIPIAGTRPIGWHPAFLSPDGASGPILSAGPYIALVVIALIIASILVGWLPQTRWTWLTNQALNLAAIAALVTCPMWWAGPSLYTYYRGRYGY